jgi:hypothetical protein
VGLVSVPIYALNGSAFSFAAFFSGAFIKAWPGIIVHIALVPPIVMALKKAKLISAEA